MPYPFLKEVTPMTTKKEQAAIDEFHAGRADRYQAEVDKRSHLVDPMTDPSLGDPPPAVTDYGERLGAVPVTRNAIADTAQAEQEGLDAAESKAPTKAEKASDQPLRASAKDVEQGKSKLGGKPKT
jgi:hypothetical protein